MEKCVAELFLSYCASGISFLSYLNYIFISCYKIWAASQYMIIGEKI